MNKKVSQSTLLGFFHSFFQYISDCSDLIFRPEQTQPVSLHYFSEHQVLIHQMLLGIFGQVHNDLLRQSFWSLLGILDSRLESVLAVNSDLMGLLKVLFHF